MTVGPRAQFIRFLFVGGLNTLFGYGVFLLLLRAGIAAGLALPIAYALGILFNFGTTRTLVFSGDDGRLWRFALVYLLLLGLNWAALRALTAAVPAWLGQGLLTLPMAALSFAAQKTFVFARTR